MFINNAYAGIEIPSLPTANNGSTQGGIASMLPLILIFFVFYFLIIRPQSKRLKEHQSMVESLSKGDRIVTGGGIIGTVQKIKDDQISIDVGEGVFINIMKQTITQCLEGKASIRPSKKTEKKTKTSSNKKEK